MSIQRIAAVAAEVRTLRSTTVAAPGGFAAALGQAAQAAPAAPGAAPAGAVATAAPTAPAAPMSLPAPAGFASPFAPIPAGAWTLGAMLGLPVMAAATAVPGIAGGVPGLLSAAMGGATAAGTAAGTAAAAPVGRAAATAGGLVMPVEGRFSSKFGPRIHPITGQSRMHSGIDLAAPSGTPIAAAAAGTVTHSGPRGGYGNLVILSHPDGSETRYAHNEANLVTVGQQVAAGEQIARVGSTGMSTGPHLHFEVRRGGEAVDPAPLLGLA